MPGGAAPFPPRSLRARLRPESAPEPEESLSLDPPPVPSPRAGTPAAAPRPQEMGPHREDVRTYTPFPDPQTPPVAPTVDFPSPPQPQPRPEPEPRPVPEVARPMPSAPVGTEPARPLPQAPPAAPPVNTYKPVFAPDDMGRRPIADSSQPIARDMNGAPMPPAAPPVFPAPVAQGPAAAPQGAPPAPMPSAPPAPAPQPSQAPARTPTIEGLAPMPSAPPAPQPLAPVPAPAPAPPPAPPPEAPRPLAPAPAPAADAGTPAPAPVANPSPLLLEKIGPASINRGAPLVYELVVRNVTNAPLSHVRVEDDLPPGVQLMSAEPRPDVQRNKMIWNLGVLDPGVERRCKIQLMPSGVGEIQTCATATFEVSACLRSLVTQPHLILKKTGPESVHVGDKAVFELDLTNDGNGPATGVVLYDCLPQGLEHPQGSNIEAEIGTMAPGETKHITLETRAVQPGRLVNRARATGHGLCVTAEAVVMVTSPALALRKAGPRARFIGREAEFDLEVQNPGTAPATNVQVLDRLPPGLEFVSASDNGAYDAETRSITWNLGTLNPGQREGISLKVVGKAEGDYVNQAFARADRNLEARAEAPIRIDGVAALMLEVVDLDDPVEVGNETVYEIHVINQGTTACTRVQIVATAPEGMVPRSGTGPSTARISGQQIIFEPVDKLAAHADATFRVRVLARTPGDWRFRVQMRSDHLQSPVLEEESTRIYADQ